MLITVLFLITEVSSPQRLRIHCIMNLLRTEFFHYHINNLFLVGRISSNLIFVLTILEKQNHLFIS